MPGRLFFDRHSAEDVRRFSGRHQTAQDCQAFCKFVRLRCKADPEVRIAPAEYIARNHQHTVGDGLFNKLVTSDSKPLWHFNERIESSARSWNICNASERIHHHLSTHFVVSNDGRQVHAETWNHAPLRHARCADIGVLLEFGDLLNDFLWSRHVSKAPTSAPVRLAEAADQQALVAESRRAWAVPVFAHVAETELVVDLVADEKHTAPSAQVDDVAKF